MFGFTACHEPALLVLSRATCVLLVAITHMSYGLSCLFTSCCNYSHVIWFKLSVYFLLQVLTCHMVQAVCLLPVAITHMSYGSSCLCTSCCNYLHVIWFKLSVYFILQVFTCHMVQAVCVLPVTIMYTLYVVFCAVCDGHVPDTAGCTLVR